MFSKKHNGAVPALRIGPKSDGPCSCALAAGPLSPENPWNPGNSNTSCEACLLLAADERAAAEAIGAHISEVAGDWPPLPAHHLSAVVTARPDASAGRK